MTKITKEQISLAYQLAETVYDGKTSLQNAKEVGRKAGISPNSMNYYCASFRHMMNGTRHTGSVGTEVRDYFLSQIFSKYDSKIKNNALMAFEQTIEYDEERNHCTQHTNRSILEKYRKML